MALCRGLRNVILLLDTTLAPRIVVQVFLVRILLRLSFSIIDPWTLLIGSQHRLITSGGIHRTFLVPFHKVVDAARASHRHLDRLLVLVVRLRSIIKNGVGDIL